jgi:hypothetical protein
VAGDVHLNTSGIPWNTPDDVLHAMLVQVKSHSLAPGAKRLSGMGLDDQYNITIRYNVLCISKIVEYEFAWHMHVT